jgi:transcriptional regulator with PAS, ATPase and Fis domain
VLLLHEEKRSWSVPGAPKGRARATYAFDDIRGSSPLMQRAKELARRFASTDLPILLEGETGTGKELFAQAIHNLSPRSEGPFMAVNCAAIPRELVESELFGYQPGAFTGARKEGQAGKFESADGGTLFLDEVNSMEPATQAKLLRVLENCLNFAVCLCDGETIELVHLPDSLLDPAGPDATGPCRKAHTLERSIVQEALESSGGRVGEAARKLGLSRSTFYRRRKQFGLCRGRADRPREVRGPENE